MEAPSLHPRLPTEVLLMVFHHLSHSDIRRLLKVNSFLRTVAEPLTYRYATFTHFGPHFPDAPQPYPFLDIPGAAHISDKERGGIAQKIERLDVKVHSSEECRSFHFLVPSKPKLDVRVLRLGLKGFDTGEFAQDFYVHSDSLPPAERDSYYEEPCDWDVPAEHAKCLFLESPWIDLKFKKLVIHDFPIAPQSNIVLPACPPKQLVGVVPTPGNLCPVYWCCDRSDSSDWDEEEGPMWAWVPTANDMTLIFWTKSPQREWPPPCYHYNGRGPGRDSACNCQVVKYVWKDLASLLETRFSYPPAPAGGRRAPPHGNRLRIVNAAAIIPPGGKQGEHRDNLSKGTASHRAAEKYLLAHRGCQRLLKNGRLDIKFLTMQEWIKTEGWEDVFTEDEIRPWLDSMAKEK